MESEAVEAVEEQEKKEMDSERKVQIFLGLLQLFDTFFCKHLILSFSGHPD